MDHLIQRYTKIQMSKAVIIQAAAAAMLEDYCDEVNEQIRRDYESRGLYLRPRFSPGYGDFPLSCQPQLLGCLEAGEADRNHIDRQLPDGSVQVGDSGDRCQSAFQNLYG